MRFIFLSLALLMCLASAPPASAKIQFPELDTAARIYADRISKTKVPKGFKPEAELAAAKLSLANLQWAQAVSSYEILAAAGSGGTKTWLELARAWRGLKPAAPESVLAAYYALTLAKTKTEETDALKLLADYLYENYQASSESMKKLQDKLKTDQADVEPGVRGTEDTAADQE
jgi:hypothetical protein